jgi:hypothetical protein
MILAFLNDPAQVQSASEEMSHNMWIEFEQTMPEMLEVCEDGQACRDDALQTTHKNVQSEWMTAYDAILREIESAKMRSNEHMATGYTKMSECDPGCPHVCEAMRVEYDNVVTQVTDIETKLNNLRVEKDKLYAHKKDIIEECPEFTNSTTYDVNSWTDNQVDGSTSTTTTTTVETMNSIEYFDGDYETYMA